MNNLNKRLYRAIKKGLLEGLDIDNIDIEDFNDIKINKMSRYKRSLLKALKYEEDYKIQLLSEKLQTLIDSGNYSLEEVYDLVKQGAIYKANNDNLEKVIKKYIKLAGNECDLNWIDTSEVTDMSYMFSVSKFNGDISNWDVSNVTNMRYMFAYSKFNGDISNWDVSNVKGMCGMFYCSDFNGDISNWNIKPNCDTEDMLYKCPIKNEYKPKILR